MATPGTLAITATAIQGWLALAGGLVAAISFVSSRLDASKAQAAQVYAIVTSYKYGEPPSPDHHTTFVIHNDSEQPIFDVGVAGWQFGDRRLTWRLRPHSKWMTGERIVGRLYPTVLPHSSTEPEDLPPVKVAIDRGDSVRPPIMLVFRDGSGRRWVRWPDGKLTRRWPSR